MWEYSPTHSRVLFRSPSTTNNSEVNIDIVFACVEYLRVSSWLADPEIWECTEEESVELDRECSRSSSEARWFRIKCHDQSYYVLATGMFIDENTDDIFQSVFFPPDFWDDSFPPELWAEFRADIVGRWMDENLEAELGDLSSDQVVRWREGLVEVLRGWFLESPSAILESSTAALNAFSLLELLALNGMGEQCLPVMRAFAGHPLAEVTGVTQVALCQIEDTLKRQGAEREGQTAADWAECFRRWMEPSN